MSSTKEIVDQESRQTSGSRLDIHLHREGTFLRAYEWSAFLACRYLHDFKVNKRQFKDIEQPVAYIGFPDTSLMKWIPEGAGQRVEGEKHLVVKLPEMMVSDDLDTMAQAFAEWKDGIPLAEHQGGKRKPSKDDSPSSFDATTHASLTSIMQRVLAFPIESKSPLESMTFLADIKRQLASLI